MNTKSQAIKNAKKIEDAKVIFNDGYADFLHPLDRTNQQLTFDKMIEAKEAGKKIIIIDAGTGFGKSALAAHASVGYQVLTLTMEKVLQDLNYYGSYRFDVLKGKSNYPCAYHADYTAEVCGIGQVIKPGDEPKNVEDLKDEYCNTFVCPYKTAKYVLKNSVRGSLNYTKFLLEPKETWNEPEFLFCDEGHRLPDIVIEYSSFTIDWSNEWIEGISKMRFVGYRIGKMVLKNIKEKLEETKPDREEEPELYVKWSRVAIRFNQCMEILERSEAAGELDSWHLVGDDKGIIIKPYTAKYNFKRMFYGRADCIVLMSATIGEWIIEALGIDPEDVEYIKVPQLYPPQDRPIYLLDDAPRISGRNTRSGCHTHKDVIKQAEIIKGIKERRINDSHVVLTNSSDHAWGIVRALALMGVPAFIPRSEGTENKMKEWNSNRRPGSICVTYSMWEGVDLGQDYSIIIAKIPFPPMGREGSFERAKVNYDMNLWKVYAVIKLIQGAGRNRRGKDEHYGLDENGSLKRMVFIIDKNVNRVIKMIPDDIFQSMRKVVHTQMGFKLVLD